MLFRPIARHGTKWLGFTGKFDVVYARTGTLGEMHAALFLYDEELTDLKTPRIGRCCFQGDPDCVDPTAVVESASYGYQHPLGSILSNLLELGCSLQRFHEYPHDVSASYAAFASQKYSLPMSYAVLASRAVD